MNKLQALKIALLIIILAEEIKRAKYNKNRTIVWQSDLNTLVIGGKINSEQ